MTDQVLKGQAVTTNSTDYNNGSKVVPTEVLPFETVYKDNYQKVLVDSGYYTAAQLT
jgi:putative multiple sugar transport system substrate-binding protein